MMTQGIWDHLNDRTGIYYIANGLGHLDTSLIEHKAVGEHALVGSRPCRCDASQQTALKPACSSAERTWCIVLWSPSRTLLICFIHPFIQSLIWSLIWSLVDSFIHSFFIHSFIHACIHSFIHPSIHPLTHSCMHQKQKLIGAAAVPHLAVSSLACRAALVQSGCTVFCALLL